MNIIDKKNGLEELIANSKMLDTKTNSYDSLMKLGQVNYNCDCYTCQCDGGCDCVCQSNCCDAGPCYS